MQTTDTKVRLRPEQRAWLDARAFLKNQSLNATIAALLDEAMEADPLAKLAVMERQGRYIVASGSTREEFRAFMREDLAMDFARTALGMAGANPDHIMELTDCRPDKSLGEAA